MHSAPFKRSTSAGNVRAAPDQVLVDIADYVLNYKIRSEQTYATARLCVTDSLACALDALDVPECTKLLGPVVPGTVVPHAARVPGTRYELDPVTAGFLSSYERPIWHFLMNAHQSSVPWRVSVGKMEGCEWSMQSS